MKKENGLNQLNENLKKHKPFKLFWKGEYFSVFEYDVKLKRYQSPIGWFSLEDVLGIAKGEDENMTIEWIE